MVWIGCLVEIRDMAGIAIGRGTLIAGGMAGSTIDGDMGSGQGEVGQAVIKCIIGITSGMAGIAGITVIGISGDSLVVIVSFRIQVTTQATEFREVGRVGMTISALSPFPQVFPAVYREVLGIVVEIRWYPGIFRMAACTIRGELCGHVIRVLGVVIIVAMAAETGVRCIVIITVVAGCAIVTDPRMCTVQRIKIPMDRECGGHPVRGGGMTKSAVRRQAQIQVVRIGRIVEIRSVASCTGIRRVIVIPVMAGCTIISYGQVCPVKNPEIVMIRELSRRPSRIRRMTGCAIG